MNGAGCSFIPYNPGKMTLKGETRAELLSNWTLIAFKNPQVAPVKSVQASGPLRASQLSNRKALTESSFNSNTKWQQKATAPGRFKGRFPFLACLLKSNDNTNTSGSPSKKAARVNGERNASTRRQRGLLAQWYVFIFSLKSKSYITYDLPASCSTFLSAYDGWGFVFAVQIDHSFF